MQESSLAEFLDDVAAPTPAPASGAAAAVTAAMAAALAELTAGLSEDGDGAARARGLRERSLALAEEDAEAYLRFVRTRESWARERTIDVPLEIAETAGEVARLAARLAEASRASFRGDAEVARLLARAAAEAAARLVEINVGSAAGDDRLRRARAAVADA